jgi:hypothetical protein
MDPETKAMLFDGLNLSQLGVAFRMDHRVLVEKLKDCSPSGTRNGVSTWTIHEAAPHLVRPIYDVEAAIKRMNHADLPKQLTKEFWNGLKAKQDYELRAGDLWPTAKVVESVGELVKLVRMSALLTTDTLERQVELTEKQRNIVKNLMDSMLNDLYLAVQEKFKDTPDEPHTESIDDQTL